VIETNLRNRSTAQPVNDNEHKESNYDNRLCLLLAEANSETCISRNPEDCI